MNKQLVKNDKSFDVSHAFWLFLTNISRLVLLLFCPLIHISSQLMLLRKTTQQNYCFRANVFCLSVSDAPYWDKRIDPHNALWWKWPLLNGQSERFMEIWTVPCFSNCLCEWGQSCVCVNLAERGVNEAHQQDSGK